MKFKRYIHIVNCLNCSNLGSFLPGINHYYDQYSGIHYVTGPESNKLSIDPPIHLVELLKKNIEVQIDAQIRTIWFHLSPENINLIEPLFKLGFNFHHAKENNVVMFKSLMGPDNIPKYSYTNIGVGGLVVNENNQVLVVKEKVKLTKFWKFPGGYAEQGEELDDAIVREVLEETGIKTKFHCILAIRHIHRSHFFDCSDLYFVCYLEPKTTEIIQCPNEIELCQWIHIDNVWEHLSKFNKFVIEKYLKWKINKFEISYDNVESNFPPLNNYNVYSIKRKK